MGDLTDGCRHLCTAKAKHRGSALWRQAVAPLVGSAARCVNLWNQLCCTPETNDTLSVNSASTQVIESVIKKF